MNKEEVIELVEIFGLVVERDQWDDKGWIRVVSEHFPNQFGYDNKCLILYREDADSSNGKNLILDELRQSLIRLGENLKQQAIKDVIGIV